MASGTLFIVATPLGNLEDMTFRAVRILKQADLIAAEDTRHSKKLLAHYNIDSRLISCHEHNEEKRALQIIDHLRQGKTIALITDAGTPCISDPGYRLVKAAAREKIPVIPVPGCSAVAAGLSVSGLPSDSFLFVGFLPRKKQQMAGAIKNLEHEKATLIFYESPRRIRVLVEQLRQTLGDRRACLAREMTKQHEEYVRGPLSAVLAGLDQKILTLGQVKGECTLFVEGCQRPPALSQEALEDIIIKELADGATGTSFLAKKISSSYNISKKKVYDTILKFQ